MARVQQVGIFLNGGRYLVACLSPAPKTSREWLVYLPESGADFCCATRRELSNLVGSKLAPRFNYLVINKPGVSEAGVDGLEFEESFRRKYRIEDAILTIRQIVPPNHRIHLVGYSEGAYLAPQIGRQEKRIRSVTMIGGGTRGWLKEELANARGAQKLLYQKKIKDIYLHPRKEKKWNGFSYATWYSYRGDHTLRALRDVRVPTLAILGARDRVIDLRSAIVDLMLVSRNQPIQVHVFGDCGHRFTRHWRHVSRVLGRFLGEQVRSP